MAGNYQNILDHQGCIPEERLLGYIEGRLSPQEANRVEQHLLECELCSDALEGLKLLHPERAREITAELNSKIDRRLESGKGGKMLPFGSFYRIAAVFVLAALFGGGYWLINNSKEENTIALNQELAPVVNKDSAVVQFEAPAGSVSRDEESVSLQKEMVTSAPKFSLEKKNEPLKQLAASDADKDLSEAKTTTYDDVKSENDVITTQSDTFYSGNEVAMSKVEVSNANQKQASNAIEDYHSSQGAPASAESKASDDMMDKSETLSYKRKKESTAKDQSESFLIADEKSLFDSGKSKYDLKNFDLAANDFEKLIKDTTSRYYDDSKWYLANCYMRTGRNTKARKLLQEISNSNSIHKKEAFGLLQEY